MFSLRDWNDAEVRMRKQVRAQLERGTQWRQAAAQPMSAARGAVAVKSGWILPDISLTSTAEGLTLGADLSFLEFKLYFILRKTDETLVHWPINPCLSF